MNKPFKNLEEQLDILKDRGMKIHDYEFSKRFFVGRRFGGKSV